MKSLDEIMSREGEAMPEQDINPIETQPEPQVEAQAEPDEASDPEPQADERGMVPHQALHAAREQGKKRYTEAVTEFERRQKESDERNEKRFADMMALLQASRQPGQPQPEQTPQQPQEAPQWWDDPDKAFEQRASQALDPVRQSLMFNARLTAEAIHDRETPGAVKEAEEAFNAAAAAGRIDPEIHRRINASPNPYHAAVQWHQHVKRQEAASKFGDDPEAYIAAEIERRLAAAQTGQSQPPQQTAQAMPSSFAAGRSAGPRAAPQWSGPKPLSEIMNGR